MLSIRPVISPTVFAAVLNVTNVLYCDDHYLKSIVIMKVVKLAIMQNLHRRTSQLTNTVTCVVQVNTSSCFDMFEISLARPRQDLNL